MRFFIADTHFGHKNIIRYENRPFQSVEEMDTELIKRWNQIVSTDDTVYHLGDFALTTSSRIAEIVPQLNGHKILIKGNHDRNHSSDWWRSVGFCEASDYPIILDDFICLGHEPIANEVYTDQIDTIHKPPAHFNEVSSFVFLYDGHVHSCPLYPAIMPSAICVSCKRWNYTPVSLTDLKAALMKYRENKE